MKTLLIKNGTVVTLDEHNQFLEGGQVLIEGTAIKAVGYHLAADHQVAKVIDARGGVILPGLINAHHHLYQALVRGYAPPGELPGNFQELLEHVWWRLDRALQPEDVYYSAIVGLLEAAKAGCTTVLDHHASPACREGSLDLLEKAFTEVGLNGCLCYEVSDRNTEGAGIEENERYLKKRRAHPHPQFAALFGLHASMTLGARTLERCAEVVDRLDAGVHVHVAEAECDHEVTRARFHEELMERFEQYGMTGPGSLFVHGIHLGHDGLARLHETNSMLVTCPESNMHNGLRVTPVLTALRNGILLGLGTDGLSNALIAQARTCYLLQRDTWRDPHVAFHEACDLLLKNNRAICDRIFEEHRGVLAPGKLADVIVLDYRPFTPFGAYNLYGHLLHGLVHAPVRHTVCRGEVIVENGECTKVDEKAIRSRALERARKLWARL